MMQFNKATKAQAKLRMAIDGPAGSGKTYTALAVGKHLGARVALVDTEHGSASKYADKFAFDTLVLQSFHPLQYIEAIKTAEAAGYDVCVIDSLSHAWAGKDGALELVDRAARKSNSGNKYVAWGDVTPLQNQLVDTILSSNMHIIATMRTKMEYSQEKENGKTVIKKIGLAPVQRDGVEYEFDIVGDLDADHNLTISKTRCAALDGAMLSKPGADLANILKAWLADGTTVVTAPPAPAEQHKATNGDDGHTTPAPQGAEKVRVPTELATLLKNNANKTYSTPEKARGARGLANGTLDEYAGDTDRRHTFLMAIFGVDSSTNLSDGQVGALLGWKDHPTAKSEVNRVIADYLVLKGQTELLPAAQPA